MPTPPNLLLQVGQPSQGSLNKITIVGCGVIGMAIAAACIAHDITHQIALIDTAEERLMGEQLDLQIGSLFMNNATVEAGNDYTITAGSKICVIALGIRQAEGEASSSLLARNFEVFKTVIPILAEKSPDSVILVISNPVDILTYVAWKLSNFPKCRVIGLGTSSDSARFRYFIAHRLHVPSTAVHGLIIGEHGFSSIPIWSGVSVAGVRLCDFNNRIGLPSDTERWGDIYYNVINSTGELSYMKEYHNFGSAFCIASICSAIIRNSGELFPLSTCVNGEQGVEKDVFMSLPCLIGSQGVTHIVQLILSDYEQTQFLKSAGIILNIINALP